MKTPRALIGCEKSGIVRRAMLARGIDAWSIDLQPSEDGSNRHITGDILDYLGDGWDLLAVMHPPCTRLCNSGVRWLKSRLRGGRSTKCGTTLPPVPNFSRFNGKSGC